MSSSAKRKAIVNGGGPSTKKTSGTLTPANPAASAATAAMTESAVTYPRKSSKSSNRREWMKECLKLLETMMELPDSKPFREPVDCLKYPGFYSQVEDPIDFSKIMLKFRGSKYQDPFDFEKDVRQLFDDYKGFFKDPNSEVYAQTHRLCWWFESEFRRILEKYGDKLKKRPSDTHSALAPSSDAASRNSPKQNANIMVSINNGSCTILQSPERNAVPALLTDHMVPVHPNPWHPSVGSKNYHVVQQIMSPLASTSAITPASSLQQHFAHSLANTSKDLYPALPSAPSPPWLDAHLRELRDKMAAERPTYSAVEKRAVYSQNRVINTSFEMTGNELHVPLVPNLYTRSLDRDPRLSTSSSSETLLRNQSSSVDVYYNSPRDYDAASHHSMSPNTRTHTPNTLQVPSPHPGYSPPCHTPQQQQQQCHSRDHSPVRSSSANTHSPVKPKVTITTATSPHDPGSVAMLVGMKLDVSHVWLGSVRGKSSAPIILHEHGLKLPFLHKETETNLHIKVEEIVRCLAHLGKNKKHTILIFVTPSCVHRIEKRLHVSNSNCSMLALFLPALSVANISRLLHTFHNMSKHSMFGASLFTEVDQRAVLGMLVNIKPDINEKMRARSGNAASLLQVDHHGSLLRSSSMPVSSNPPPAAASPDTGALDLTVARGNGMFHSASVDSPTTAGGAGANKVKHQPKAYKPKFHFRSNRLDSQLMRQHSTMIEPQFDSGMGSSSEESAPTPRPALLKGASADSNDNSNESGTGSVDVVSAGGGSDVIKKEEDAESDLDLDYDEEEALEGSTNSVLLVLDSNDEELALIEPYDEEMDVEEERPFQSYPHDVSISREALPLERYSRVLPPHYSYVMRNPYCGHSYDRDGLVQLIHEQQHKAVCPMVGCSNDRPLASTKLIFGCETTEREPIVR